MKNKYFDGQNKEVTRLINYLLRNYRSTRYYSSKNEVRNKIKNFIEEDKIDIESVCEVLTDEDFLSMGNIGPECLKIVDKIRKDNARE